METSRLPFRIGSLYGGCAKIDGIIILSSEYLTLEYRMSDAWIGAWNGGITTRTLAWSDLERAECGLGFFSPWLILSARRMNTFDKLPSSDGLRLRVGVRWKDRRQLRAVTSEINLVLSFNEADRYRHRLPGA